MTSKSVKGWAAGIGLSTLAGIYGYTQLFDSPEHREDPQATEEIHLLGGVASNPFATIKTGQAPEAEVTNSPVNTAWAAASEQPKAKESELSQDAQRQAISFFRKYEAEQNDFARKLDYISFALAALNNDIKNAPILGLDERTLAAMIRHRPASNSGHAVSNPRRRGV